MRNLSWLTLILFVLLLLSLTRAMGQEVCEGVEAINAQLSTQIGQLNTQLVEKEQSCKKQLEVRRESNERRKSMHTWMPVYAGGFNLGVCKEGYEGDLNFGVSVMGYGKNKSDLDFRFLQLGVNLSPKFDAIGVNIVPILWRPFPENASNTSFGPGIGYGTRGLNGFINGSIRF